MFGAAAAEVCQSVFPALEIHGMNLEWPLSVFQGLCLRGERQKHAGAEVPRVPMWYSCRSHRHKSPRNLLQSGCRHGPRLCINEPAALKQALKRSFGWPPKRERFYLLLFLPVTQSYFLNLQLMAISLGVETEDFLWLTETRQMANN